MEDLPYCGSVSVTERRELQTAREGWQGEGFDYLWIFRSAMAIASRFPKYILDPLTEATVDWYLSRHPKLISILAGNLAGLIKDQSPVQLEKWARETLSVYARGQVDYLCAMAHENPYDCVPLELPKPKELNRLSPHGEGQVIVLCHGGFWELGGLLFGLLGREAVVAAAPEKDPELDQLRHHLRSRAGLGTVPVGGGMATLFSLQKALERGAFVVAIVERALGRDRIKVKFGHREAYFLRSPFLWAWRTKVSVTPNFIPWYDGAYRCRIGPPIRPEKGEDAMDFAARAAQSCADWFTEIIRQYPRQWYNFYPYWESA